MRSFNLNHRIVLSPFAAMGLAAFLQQLMKELRGPLRSAFLMSGRFGGRTLACMAAIAVALALPACRVGNSDVSDFLGPQPGVVNVYRRSGEINERFTYIEGVSARGKEAVTVREQTRMASDRPEQPRVLGQALEYEIFARDGGLIQGHKTTGRIRLKIPTSETVRWKDGVENVPGPVEAPRFQCSAEAPISKPILGKDRQTVLVTCELAAAGGGTPLREVTLYAEGIGIAEQTDSFIDPPSSPGSQRPIRMQLIAIQAAR